MVECLSQGQSIINWVTVAVFPKVGGYLRNPLEDLVDFHTGICFRVTVGTKDRGFRIIVCKPTSAHALKAPPWS